MVKNGGLAVLSSVTHGTVCPDTVCITLQRHGLPHGTVGDNLLRHGLPHPTAGERLLVKKACATTRHLEAPTKERKPANIATQELKCCRISHMN